MIKIKTPEYLLYAHTFLSKKGVPKNFPPTIPLHLSKAFKITKDFS